MYVCMYVCMCVLVCLCVNCMNKTCAKLRLNILLYMYIHTYLGASTGLTVLGCLMESLDMCVRHEASLDSRACTHTHTHAKGGESWCEW